MTRVTVLVYVVIGVACHSTRSELSQFPPAVLVVDQLNCSGRPMNVQIRSHQDAEVIDQGRDSSLLVVGVRDARTRDPLEAVVVGLTERQGPDAPFVTGILTDSTGRGQFKATPNQYFLRVLYIGYNGGDTLIALKPGVVDSAAIELHQSAIC